MGKFLNDTKFWFKTIYENSPIAIEIYDSNGFLLDVNEACLSLFGVRHKEMVTGFNLFDDPNIPKEQLIQLKSGKKIRYESEFDFERVKELKLYVTNRSGKSYLDVLITPISLSEGGDDGFLVQIIDITDRVKAERNLRESEVKFRGYFDNSTEGIFIADAEGNYIEVNDAASQISGYSKEELLSKNIINLIPQDSRALAINHFNNLKEVGKSSSELQFIRKNGETGYWIVSAVRLSENRFLGVVKDVTERKEEEEEIRESEKRFRNLFENSGDAIFIADIETGYIIDANKSASRLMQMPIEKIIGLHQSKLHPTTLLTNGKFVFSQHIEDTSDSSGVLIENEIIRPDGTIVPVELIASRINIHGKECLIGTFRDISLRKVYEKQLAHDKQRLNDILLGTNVGTWEWNIQTGECIFNERWAEMIGYTLEELSPITINTWMKFAHPEDLEASGELLNKHFNGEIEYYDFEARMRHKDGRWIWVHDRGKAASWTEDGRPLWMFGTHQEITDRKEAELKLKEKDNLLKELSAQVPGAIYQFQFFPDGRICMPFASDNLSEVYELTPEEVKNDASIVISRVHPDDSAGVINSINHSFNTLTNWDYDYRVILPVKGLRWLKGHARPQKQTDGSVLWHGFITDITERKNNQIEVERIKEIFELAINGTNDGIWDWNIRSNSIFFSKRWKSMLGYEEHELENNYKTFESLLIDQQEVERVNNILNKYLNGEMEKYEVELRMKHKDGSFRWILSKGELVADSEGNPFRMAGTHSDITQRKLIEIELLNYKNHLEELVNQRTIELADINNNLNREIQIKRGVEEQLKEALLKEKELSQIKSQFISTASHEFRTPLTSILSSAELIQRFVSKGEHSKLDNQINKIITSIDRLTKLMDDVLLINKAESNKALLNPSKINLEEVCLKIINQTSVYANVKHKFNFNYKTEIKEFTFDQKHIELILSNLLSNAFKYSPNGGEINFDVLVVENQLNFNISDQGMGIPAEDIIHVFDTFYRGMNIGTIQGTGLGLPIVKYSVDLLGGSILVSSKVNVGSEFVVKIPIQY